MCHSAAEILGWLLSMMVMVVSSSWLWLSKFYNFRSELSNQVDVDYLIMYLIFEIALTSGMLIVHCKNCKHHTVLPLIAIICHHIGMLPLISIISFIKYSGCLGISTPPSHCNIMFALSGDKLMIISIIFFSIKSSSWMFVLLSAIHQKSMKWALKNQEDEGLEPLNKDESLIDILNTPIEPVIEPIYMPCHHNHQPHLQSHYNFPLYTV